MGKAVTLHTKKSGSKELRVVSRDGVIYGLIDGKVVLQGNNPDEMMSSLKEEACKSSPKYFGFDGARNRFLHWFKDGFGSAEYIKEERAYKWDTKSRLEKQAPLAKALTGSGFGPGNPLRLSAHQLAFAVRVVANERGALWPEG